MGDDHTPPGMIRLTTEIDRLTGDDSNTPPPSVLKPTRRRGAKVSASDILAGKSDLQSIMKAVRAGQAAAEDARRREAETVDRRLRGWGALRQALASGTRRGWWWFVDFDGRTEAIPLHWWNSSAAEDAASHGVVTLMRANGPNIHSLKAIVVIEEKPHPPNKTIATETAARKYLTKYFSENPSPPAGMSLTSLGKNWQDEFPGLGSNGWKRIKSAALDEVGAEIAAAWRKTGPKSGARKINQH